MMFDGRISFPTRRFIPFIVVSLLMCIIINECQLGSYDIPTVLMRFKYFFIIIIILVLQTPQVICIANQKLVTSNFVSFNCLSHVSFTI